MLLYNIVWVLHLIIVVLLIATVLIQTGKGSEVGFAFGAGAAQTMFGSGGGKSFITKFTVILAVSFMATSIFLAFYQARVLGDYRGVVDKVKAEQSAPAPASNEPPPVEKPAAQ